MLNRQDPGVCRLALRYGYWGMLAILLTSCSDRESTPSLTAMPDVASISSTADQAPENPMPDPASTPVPLIAPGTVVAEQAGEGWTHLIVKSQPEVGLGDVDKLAESLKALSNLFFSAMMARVQPEKTGDRVRTSYRLDEVAIGLGTRIGARDTIITPETQKGLGADLGFLAQTALKRGYERLQTVRVVARSSTMALIDGPATMLRDQKHRPVVLRYAVLVDPQDGRLETVLWSIGQNDKGEYEGMFGAGEWLPPNMVEKRILHVDSSEFCLGLVTEKALAMVRLYQGRKQVAFPEDVKRIAERARLTQESAADLEKKLRALIRPALAQGTAFRP